MEKNILGKGCRMDFRRKFFVLCAMLIAGLILVPGCGEEKHPDSSENGKLLIRAGLPPVAFIASRVGGERVESKSMLPEGRSPHDYSPQPHDVLDLARAKFLFVTRLSFEKRLAESLKNAATRIVDVTEPGVEWIPFDGVAHDCEEHSRDGHDHGAMDLHVWLSLENASVIAENICRALSEADPEGREYYEANLAALKKEFADAENFAKKELEPWRGREFFVYHPAFGYFGHMTGLRQVAVELDGREATPAHLLEIIRKARAENVKVIFVQPQFNPGSTRALAEAIDGEVEELNPLEADIVSNTRRMVEVLKRGFTGERSPEK